MNHHFQAVSSRQSKNTSDYFSNKNIPGEALGKSPNSSKMRCIGLYKPDKNLKGQPSDILSDSESAGRKMQDVVEVGKLPKLLEEIDEDKREAFLKDVRETITVSKDAGLKLGEKLRGMRDALKAKKRWYPVVDELAKITGYAGRTILRWVDGDEKPKEKPVKPEFQKHREIRSLANRLKSNHSLDAEAVADFASRAMELTISEGPDGDAEAVSYLTRLIESIAALRSMNVTVEIKAVA